MAATKPSDGSSSPYRRDNWHGDNEVRAVADQHGTDWSNEEITNDKAASVAHKILRGVAPAICLVSKVDPAKEPVELTDPAVYPHGDGNRQHIRKARVNELDGYITGGESSGVVLGDLPAEEFFDVVEILLAIWQKTAGISERQASKLMVDAKRMKSTPDISDEEAISRLVRDVLTPGEIGDNN